MELSQFLRVAAFFAVFGGVIGVLIGYAIRSSSKDSDRSSVRKKRESKPSFPANQESILRIWQDVNDGPLNLELDGKTVSTSAEMNAEQKNRLKQLVVFLYRWIEKPESSTAKRTKPPQEPIQPSRPDKNSSQQPSPAESNQESSPTTFAETLPEEPKIRDAFRLSPFKRKSESDTSTSEPEPPPQSIAAQIDEILQAKLQNSTLIDQHIKLIELPIRGMIIMVGKQQYETVDEIPDPKIKGLIKSAVEEWNRRHNRS